MQYPINKLQAVKIVKFLKVSAKILLNLSCLNFLHLVVYTKGFRNNMFKK